MKKGATGPPGKAGARGPTGYPGLQGPFGFKGERVSMSASVGQKLEYYVANIRLNKIDLYCLIISNIYDTHRPFLFVLGYSRTCRRRRRKGTSWRKGTTFYDLKVTFGYIGESPENIYVKYIHGKYEYFENNSVFFGPNMAASQLS